MSCWQKWLHKKVMDMVYIPEEIRTALMKDEEILYARHEPGNFDGFILTNKRVITYVMKKSLLGKPKPLDAFSDYNWQDLKIASIDEGIRLSGIYLDMGKGIDIRWDNLPKDEAKKIYSIALEMKKAAQEGSSNTQTPTQNLKYLKEMLDEGLITQTEYEAKKADILSRM